MYIVKTCHSLTSVFQNKKLQSYIAVKKKYIKLFVNNILLDNHCQLYTDQIISSRKEIADPALK